MGQHSQSDERVRRRLSQKLEMRRHTEHVKELENLADPDRGAGSSDESATQTPPIFDDEDGAETELPAFREQRVESGSPVSASEEEECIPPSIFRISLLGSASPPAPAANVGSTPPVPPKRLRLASAAPFPMTSTLVPVAAVGSAPPSVPVAILGSAPPLTPAASVGNVPPSVPVATVGNAPPVLPKRPRLATVDPCPNTPPPLPKRLTLASAAPFSMPPPPSVPVAAVGSTPRFTPTASVRSAPLSPAASVGSTPPLTPAASVGSAPPLTTAASVGSTPPLTPAASVGSAPPSVSVATVESAPPSTPAASVGSAPLSVPVATVGSTPPSVAVATVESAPSLTPAANVESALLSVPVATMSNAPPALPKRVTLASAAPFPMPPPSVPVETVENALPSESVATAGNAPALPHRRGIASSAHWYFPDLSRAEASNLLLNETESGVFLVRDSKTIPGDYVLCVREDGRVSHYIINRVVSADGTTRYRIGDQLFADMPALLSFYRLHYLDSTPLVRPLPLASSTLPQQHIALEVVQAKYDFTGNDADDLPFRRGEKLMVITRDEEQWWTAKNSQGRIGSIPVPYVERIPTTDATQLGVDPPSPQGPKQRTNKQRILPAMARVRQTRVPNAYDRTALKLEEGDLVKVTKMNINGQWEGELNGKVGHFPFTYVEFIDDDATS